MTTHKGVSAAEKYAELEARGNERPKCDCHGLPNRWHSDARQATGGRWECWEKNREARKRYRASHPEKIRKEKHKDKEELRSRGLCVDCRREPLATAWSWRCNKCLDKGISPERLLKGRRAKALKRRMEKRHRTGRV